MTKFHIRSKGNNVRCNRASFIRDSLMAKPGQDSARTDIGAGQSNAATARLDAACACACLARSSTVTTKVARNLIPMPPRRQTSATMPEARVRATRMIRPRDTLANEELSLDRSATACLQAAHSARKTSGQSLRSALADHSSRTLPLRCHDVQEMDNARILLPRVITDRPCVLNLTSKAVR